MDIFYFWSVFNDFDVFDVIILNVNWYCFVVFGVELLNGCVGIMYRFGRSVKDYSFFYY